MSYAIPLPKALSGWFSERTQSISSTSRIIEDISRSERDRMTDTETFGQMQRALYQTYQECNRPGWDGYGAFPVTAATLKFALWVITSLPPDLPQPSFGAEPDGHLTMEWYKSPRRVFSVSLDSSGDLHYAALLGAERVFGQVPFCGQFPETLNTIIMKVLRL